MTDSRRFAARAIAQTQQRDLHRRIEWREDEQLLRDAVTRVFENAVALTMPDDVRLSLANRQRRGGPDGARIFIAQVDHFSRRIADGVVGPGRQTILAAVERPRAAATGFGDLKSKLDRIADDVGPGRGRPLFRAEQRDVFTSALMKSAEPVEESRSGGATVSSG